MRVIHSATIRAQLAINGEIEHRQLAGGLGTDKGRCL
jgi:hypothetical protein